MLLQKATAGRTSRAAEPLARRRTALPQSFIFTPSDESTAGPRPCTPFLLHVLTMPRFRVASVLS